MEEMIKQLNEMYKEEIEDIVKKIQPERVRNDGKSINFGGFLNDAFNITGLDSYDNYVNMMNKVEEHNPQLAFELEKYLTKEINLMTLLALHVAHTNRGEKEFSLEEVPEKLG